MFVSRTLPLVRGKYLRFSGGACPLPSLREYSVIEVRSCVNSHLGLGVLAEQLRQNVLVVQFISVDMSVITKQLLRCAEMHQPFFATL